MHARIQDGVVVEIIRDLLATQYPAPQPFPEGYQPNADEQAEFDEAQALHDAFIPGSFVPIEQRYHPDFVAQMVAIPDGVVVEIGMVYADGQFAEPPPPPVMVPQTVSQRQAHLALLDAGFYLQAEAAIEAIADPTEKLKAQIEWKSPTYDRQSAFLVNFWVNVLGQAEADLDALFITASQK